MVHHRCGHEDIKGASAYFKEPKSFHDENNERIAGLKGMPALLPVAHSRVTLLLALSVCVPIAGRREEDRRGRTD